MPSEYEMQRDWCSAHSVAEKYRVMKKYGSVDVRTVAHDSVLLEIAEWSSKVGAWVDEWRDTRKDWPPLRDAIERNGTDALRRGPYRDALANRLFVEFGNSYKEWSSERLLQEIDWVIEKAVRCLEGEDPEDVDADIADERDELGY